MESALVLLFSTQPFLGALRDDTRNGCEEDYMHSSECLFFFNTVEGYMMDAQ